MRQKPRTTPIPPPSDDKERDEIAESTLLSLTMHKTALVAEAQDNFAYSVFQDNNDDSGNRLDPESHKANLEVFDDDDDDVDDNVDKEKKNDDVEEKKDDMNDDN
ncbi:hypothetical protein Tco_1324405, partial [Tanacetum coccineum]